MHFCEAKTFIHTVKWLELRNKRNGLFWLIQNIDRKRERDVVIEPSTDYSAKGR